MIVEDVARALAGWTPNVTSWADACDDPKDAHKLQAIYHRDARAAIAAVFDALEEPSEGMIGVGIVERHEQAVPEAWNLATANIWRAMLAQARREALEPLATPPAQE